jgi:hypothetical protein
MVDGTTRVALQCFSYTEAVVQAADKQLVFTKSCASTPAQILYEDRFSRVEYTKFHSAPTIILEAPVR